MNLSQWQKRAGRGTSGDMVHDILADWQREQGMLLEAARDAITALEHIPPSGCWSTGPLTGDAIEDHVVCPGCRAISKLRAAIAQTEAETGAK